MPGKFRFPAQVGDIAFDASTDRANFFLCDSARIYQYYRVGSSFDGEHRELVNYFRRHYRPGLLMPAASGYLVIRFVLNCRGETDRFRVKGVGFDFQDRTFPPAIVKQLLHLTRELRGWRPGQSNNTAADSYVYLTFILQNGQLADVAP